MFFLSIQDEDCWLAHMEILPGVTRPFSVFCACRPGYEVNSKHVISFMHSMKSLIPFPRRWEGEREEEAAASSQKFSHPWSSEWAPGYTRGGPCKPFPLLTSPTNVWLTSLHSGCWFWGEETERCRRGKGERKVPLYSFVITRLLTDLYSDAEGCACTGMRRSISCGCPTREGDVEREGGQYRMWWRNWLTSVPSRGWPRMRGWGLSPYASWGPWICGIVIQPYVINFRSFVVCPTGESG